MNLSDSASILVYGRDSNLLKTRRWVLETIGSKVYATTSLKETEQLIISVKPTLLVLCFTLSSEDRRYVLKLVQALRPQMKVLTLTADGPAGMPEGNDFNIFAGTAALKLRAIEMLN